MSCALVRTRREIAMLDKINDLEHCLALDESYKLNAGTLCVKLQRDRRPPLVTQIFNGIYGM